MLIITNHTELSKLHGFTLYAQDFTDYRECGVCADPSDAEYEETAEIPRGFRQLCLPARYGDYLTRREIETYLPLERGEIAANTAAQADTDEQTVELAYRLALIELEVM